MQISDFSSPSFQSNPSLDRRRQLGEIATAAMIFIVPLLVLLVIAK